MSTLLKGRRGTRQSFALFTGLVIATWGPAAWANEPDVRDAAETVAKAKAEQKNLKVRSFALNQFQPKLDGQWQGMRYAADGNVYFGSSSHAHDAAGIFCKYDPRAGKLTVLAKDLSALCCEDAAKQVPQGKLHSDIVEANGWVYFATHLANYWDEAAERFTGSHVVGYELKTGKFHPFGVIKPRFSCYSGIAVDPAGKFLYNIVVPWAKEDREASGARIVRTDVATGEKTDLGEPGRKGRDNGFHMFADTRGDCWFTLGSGGATLYVARAGTGKLESFPDVLPGEKGGWVWGQATDKGDRYVFTVAGRRGDVGGGAVWEFDPAKMPDKEAAFRKLAAIGPTGLGMTMAGGRVYYIQRADAKGGTKAADHHLYSASLEAKDDGAVIDHGLIVDQDGRTPWRVESLAADGKGKVFMTGDVRLLAGEKGTLRLEYDGKAEGDARFPYSPQWRGQFFMVADVSADLKDPQAAGRRPVVSSGPASRPETARSRRTPAPTGPSS